MIELERTPTAFDDRIYGPDWHAWRDPAIPNYLLPTEILLERHLPAAADKTAIIAGGRNVSYGALHALVQRIAGGLAALGAQPDQRMLFFANDSVEYVATWLAAIQVGLVPAVVSELYKTAELLYFLTDTACTLLFIDEEQISKLGELAELLPATLATVLVRGTALPALVGPRCLALDDLPASPSPPRHPRHANDVTYMFYSGGTTGQAKGITHLAHDFLLVPARQGAFWNYDAHDIVYATSRKYFTHGIWPGLLIPLAHGATLVLDRRPPVPEVVLENLARHRVTKLISVPTVLKNLLEQAGNDTRTLPDLRLVVSASEKIPPELFERFHARFGVEILDSIGSSEISYEWIANRPAEAKRGSLGKPIFGYQIRLVDESGADVTEPNQPGEAWVSSVTSCFFYWRKFRQSRETFIGQWTRTGDVLMFDEDGYFWFHSRGNDLFKVRGLWVSPLEIEAALTAHPAVLEAAVVAFSDAEGLTRPVAYLVLRDGHVGDEALFATLGEAVRPLGGYKIPARFSVVASLPRTTLMKIDRRSLRGL
jgi:acyl-coenzyme A synthetase/AMP-(fatty) acid ligase